MAATGKIEWTPELVEALIENVSSNKVVWDTSNANYKNKNVQESAWLKIASECGLEGKASSIKAKWRDLKDTYRKKLKLLIPKSGDSGGTKKATWQWMSQMSFMKKFSIVETPTSSNFLTINEEESRRMGLLSNDTEADISDLSLTLDDPKPDSPACSSSASAVSNTEISKAPNFSGKRRKRDESLNQVDLAILSELNKDKDDDEDSLFMKCLIPQLRRLEHKKKALIKCQIQQLLFQAEFESSFEDQ
ncbi:uncharacterized protein LOC124444477 [Xenia sp. Carnegie-2017]|uniref:uncharacterized protein LOC124444477 n=1 Tax=Xenia sp. Carnegie-2017 TaxID=2897299 RepID=UPI001F03E2D3|nr:uncharacterized protein LOC124444477 [Xenia sp. Carnegie-2017]